MMILSPNPTTRSRTRIAVAALRGIGLVEPRRREIQYEVGLLGIRLAEVRLAELAEVGLAQIRPDEIGCGEIWRDEVGCVGQAASP